MNNSLQILKKLYFKLPLEAMFWFGSLVYFALINPYASEHLNLCVFNQLGIDFCPGCGLGRSISMILHGDFVNSLQTHPLGLFALTVLVYRIFSILSGKKITLIKHKEVLNG